MPGNLSTYSVEDFLLFDARVYWRLFENANLAAWPLQLVALALGAACLAAIVRGHSQAGRLTGIVLAAAWAMTSWLFLYRLYLPVNWAVVYVLPAFVAQAVLLAACAPSGGPAMGSARGPGFFAGIGLFAYALFVHPLMALAAGRELVAAESFAVAPDATAIATLGAGVLARRGAVGWTIMLVPCVWCLASAATLYALGSTQAVIPLAAVAVAILARAAGAPRREGGR